MIERDEMDGNAHGGQKPSTSGAEALDEDVDSVEEDAVLKTAKRQVVVPSLLSPADDQFVDAVSTHSLVDAVTAAEREGNSEGVENSPFEPELAEEAKQSEEDGATNRGEEGEGEERDTAEEGPLSPPQSPSSPQRPRPSLFSLAQVSHKLGELWTSAREQIFGEDYWIPNDPNEICVFPHELLKAHKSVFPIPSTSQSPAARSPLLCVVQGSQKNRPGTLLHHVVLNFSHHRQAFSLFRSVDPDDAIDLCRRCLECEHLFILMDRRGDTRKPVAEIIAKLRLYPLWKMVHIAIAINREDIFAQGGVEFINMNSPVPMEKLIATATQPEGKTPLMLAIEMGRTQIVRRLLELGADPTVRDRTGSSAMHYAALASVTMLEILWERPAAKQLINATNNEGYTPVMLAIRAANPLCLRTLLGFGAELSILVAGKNPLFEAMQSKGKSTEVIKTLLDASPQLVKERDEATGNTALHAAQYKTPLMGLLLLKHKELDLNARNNAGQTPLHLYTHRHELGLIVTLASYGCDVDARDSAGNTALHIAVSARSVPLTRLLLTLGAEPNLANDHGDTPRHLAARLRHPDLLRSLAIAGAARCPSDKNGCVSGCVHAGALQLSRTSSGPIGGGGGASAAGPSSADEVGSPRASAALFAELDAPPPPEAPKSTVLEYINELHYNAALDKVQRQPEQLVNLLSLDGGGIRGLVIVLMLMELEKELDGESVFDYFDWVAGTSTGGLLAVALSQGKRLRECQHIYLRFKDLIFDGWTLKSNSALLEVFMKEVVGEDSMRSIPSPRLMISTVAADYFPVKLEFMRNYRLPLSDEENAKLGFTDPDGTPIWKALRRTSAAPMFFSPSDGKYIDGGLISNNPCVDLIAEVQLYNHTNSYLKRQADKVDVGCVLSVGTGQIPSTPLDPLHVDFSNPILSALSFKNLSLILIDQVTATEGAPVDRSAAYCSTIGVPFFRLSAPLHKEVSLGAKDDAELAAMMWDCVEYAHRQRPYLRRICQLLKKSGPRNKRNTRFSDDAKHKDCETQTTPQPSLSPDSK